MDMRGLAHFIQDIRKATSNRDDEQKRIDVELSKIRSKFRETGKLSAYDRKKYVCKLMFIAMLGYTVDFGHMEGVQLLSGESSSEKLIGYLSLSVFLNENHELLTLTTHTVHLDLLSGKEFNTCLALTAIGNAGGKDFAEAMSHGVEKLILAKVSPNVKKKALLAMLRLYRKYKDVVDLSKIVPVATELITEANMGVANCAVTLVQGVLDSSSEIEGLLTHVPTNCILMLERIIMHKSTEVDYIYYSVPAPWLQAKILRLLQYFPRPEPALFERAVKVLEKIQSATDRVLADAQTHQRQRGTQNRCNAMNAVLAEVVSLAIQWDCKQVLDPCQKILKTFVRDRKDSNLRYMGLGLTTRLSFCPDNEARFATHVEELQQEIFLSLEDPDISIRKKALELLYSTCTQQTARDIIDRFVEYVPHAEPSFMRELVLVIAALAEKYCTDNAWYCETILHLLQYAGECVPEGVWHRLIHVVVASPTIHKRITEVSFAAMQSRSAPEVVVNVTAFLLGEFGYTIAVNAGSEPMTQVTALHSRLDASSPATRCVILSCLCKLYNLYAVPSVRDRIVKVFEQYKSSVHPEIQQRAAEYYALVTTLSDDVLQLVLEPLPPFTKESSVMQYMLERQRGADRDVWGEKARVRDERQVAAATALRGTAASAPAAAASASASVLTSSTATIAKVDVEKAFDRISAANVANAPKRSGEEESMRTYFVPLAMGGDKGPLYASSALRVGITQEYRGADGRLSLAVENRLATPIQGFSMAIASTPSNLILQSKPAPDTIPAGGSVSILLACRCLGGYSDYPCITLTWQGGAPVRIKLPVGVQKFISPYQCAAKQDFEALWGNTAAGNSALATVPQPFAIKSRDALITTLGRMGFAVVGGQDDASRVMAAASFASLPLQNVYQPVLIHVAIDGPQGASLLIKSPAPELQSTVKALLCEATM